MGLSIISFFIGILSALDFSESIIDLKTGGFWVICLVPFVLLVSNLRNNKVKNLFWILTSFLWGWLNFRSSNQAINIFCVQEGTYAQCGEETYMLKKFVVGKRFGKMSCHLEMCKFPRSDDSFLSLNFVGNLRQRINYKVFHNIKKKYLDHCKILIYV